MAQLTISLLGSFQASLENKALTSFATNKARALLAYLAVEADRPHRRGFLAGLLWPDQLERTARQNLRQALSHLRQTIAGRGDDETARPFLLVTRNTVQFNLDSDYCLDVEGFTTRIAAAQSHRHRRLEACRLCVRRLEEVGELYRGSFLAQFYLGDSNLFEEWALLKREWLHRQAVEALSHLANYYERRGEYERARRHAWRQVELEPWREEGHRQLMRLLTLEGQRSAALAQYQSCRQALVAELAVEPTAETVRLYERIRAGEDLTPASLAHNLPPARTPFVGREQELEELADLLVNPDCRLLTLVGPGGIGKTRLALQAAGEQLGAFAHGVHFAPLASVSSAELIVPTLANVLKFAFDGPKDTQRQLLNYLAEKELLLALDNLEQLLAGGALLSQILSRAPGVVLLVTSRERLGLQEEWIYELEGLTYPAFSIPHSPPATLDLTTYSAIDLFLQRAGQVQRGYEPPEADMPHAARICQLVEGMPLAVELAVASLAVCSCEEIAGEIERNLDVLTTCLRNVPERHRSIWATFEHSWNLLAERERQVFQKLSVFRGGFERDAAEQVAGASRPVLIQLAHKSLLRWDGSRRYEIHQLLRQYAAEKLESGPLQAEATRGRHASFYASFLQQREAALTHAGEGEKQRQILEEIGREIDNLRSAWRWAVGQMERGQNEALAAAVLGQSAEGLHLFYVMRDWNQEGEEAFGRAAAALDGLDKGSRLPIEEKELLLGKLLARQGKCCTFTRHSDKAQRLFERSLAIFRRLDAWRETALPLYGLGYMAHIKGEYQQAERHFLRSMAVYRQVGDHWGIANALSDLCLVARRLGAFAEAKRRGQESLAIRREIGDQIGIAACLSKLGLVHCDLGEYAEAKEALLEALQMRRLGGKSGMGDTLAGLCQAAFRLGEIEQAQQFGRQSLAVYQEAGDHWGVAIAHNNLGRMAAELGDYAKAKRLYQEGLAVYHQIGIKSGLANTLGNLGEACYKLGEYAEAREHLQKALEIAHEIDATPTVLKNLIGLAPLLAREGKTVQSLELLAFAASQSAITRENKKQATLLFAELATDLIPEEVTAAETRGKARSLGEVVERMFSDAPGK